MNIVEEVNRYFNPRNSVDYFKMLILKPRIFGIIDYLAQRAVEKGLKHDDILASEVYRASLDNLISSAEEISLKW